MVAVSSVKCCEKTMADGGKIAENYGTNPPHRLGPKSLILSYGTYPASLLGELWNKPGQPLVRNWNIGTEKNRGYCPFFSTKQGGKERKVGPKSEKKKKMWGAEGPRFDPQLWQR